MKQNNSPYALWLPAWYPSRVDPLNGDFIKRHAEATSIFFPIVVLTIIKDPSITKKERSITQFHQLTEIKLYYPVTSSWSWLEKICSFILFCYYTIRESKIIIDKKGKPFLIHIHIFRRIYLLGAMIAFIWKLPLIFSEHQTDFLKESEKSIHSLSTWKKICIRILLKKATTITTVSQYLANHLQPFISDKKIEIIPNVVDTKIFTATQSLNQLHSFRLIHISTLSTNKNISHIIEAVDLANATEDKPIYHLTVVGPIQKHQAKKNVVFLSEMPQEQLAKQLTSAHVLILYSTYETFGCVTIEALASGRPVILSNIPVSYELIREKEHGLIAQINEPRDLANKIMQLKQDYELYDFDKLSQYAHQKFNYEAIGKKFMDLYTRLINP